MKKRSFLRRPLKASFGPDSYHMEQATHVGLTHSAMRHDLDYESEMFANCHLNQDEPKIHFRFVRKPKVTHTLIFSMEDMN